MAQLAADGLLDSVVVHVTLLSLAYYYEQDEAKLTAYCNINSIFDLSETTSCPRSCARSCTCWWR